MSATEPDHAEVLPTSFSEIDQTIGGACCRICSEPATHHMTLVVRVPRQGMKGTPPTVAQHKQDYCETHAVERFVKFKKAMR